MKFSIVVVVNGKEVKRSKGYEWRECSRRLRNIHHGITKLEITLDTGVVRSYIEETLSVKHLPVDDTL